MGDGGERKGTEGDGGGRRGLGHRGWCQGSLPSLPRALVS